MDGKALAALVNLPSGMKKASSFCKHILTPCLEVKFRVVSSVGAAKTMLIEMSATADTEFGQMKSTQLSNSAGHDL